jgi:hypothetical protein
MNLFDLAKLPAKSIRVIDKSNERSEPLSWTNRITIIHGANSITVWRKTAYNHGLCLGAKGLPVQHSKSEIRQNPGRRSPDKEPVTIQVSREIIKEFGGLRKMQKTLITFVESKI